MFVRYWMTQDVVTVRPDESLLAASDLMRRHSIRRLPVVENDQLVGILALSDLRRYTGPGQEKKAELLRSVERNLIEISVSEIMARSLITCSPETLLEDVGELMRKHKIGSVPVLQSKKLVGIVTETDFLKAIAQLAHLGEGRRICFRTPVGSKTKTFYDLVALCKSFNLELLTLSTQPIDNDTHHLVLLRVRGPRVEEFIKSLWANHSDVLLAE